jgi:hypothetical protein
MVQRYVDGQKEARQPVHYIQVEDAGHAFFEQMPRELFRKIP